jgi:excinuclease ABC subunit A
MWTHQATVFCPHCQRPLDVVNSQEMVQRIAELPLGSRLHLLAPILVSGENLQQLSENWIAQGFVRAHIDGAFVELAEIPKRTLVNIPKEFAVVVDRWLLKDGLRSRIADSVAIALRIGQGSLWIHRGETGLPLFLSLHPRCPEHGTLLSTLEPGLFSPHSPLGRCPHCEGSGEINDAECPVCKGDRLQEILLQTRFLKYSWRSIQHFEASELITILEPLFATLPEQLRQASQQVRERLHVMERLGIGHLALGRGVRTLSDGEWQRLRLVGLAGGHLNGILFVLDEPGSGLHPKDCERIWSLLEEIRSRGNTLLLIEHQPSFLRQADYLIEMGPGAGELGGEILRQGTRAEVLAHADSPTRLWLESLTDALPKTPALPINHPMLRVVVRPFRNLKSMHLEIPTGAFTVLCGVSGSGKSTLLSDGIAPALRSIFQSTLPIKKGKHPSVRLESPAWCTIENHPGIEALVEASSEGLRASHRSTVATATGLMTPLRDLFASLPEARTRGFGPSFFSLNTAGGRCESCLGLGSLEDPSGFGDYTCHVCQGKRFRDEILNVRFKTLNIAEILDLTVDKACSLFSAIPGFSSRLSPVRDTGLGYLSLGQPTTHLSGGELQRLGLAIELAKTSSRPTLHIFDEPARGLHRLDIDRLIELFRQLTKQGHTIIAIEHQPTFVRSADWILELGPGAAQQGGVVLHCGPLDTIKGNSESRIAPYC